MCACIDRSVHSHQRGIVRHHLRCLQLTRVPSWSLVWRILQKVTKHSHIALGIWLVQRHNRTRLIPNPAKYGVDYLDVGAVPVDKYELVPPVMDEAAGDVVKQLV